MIPENCTHFIPSNPLDYKPEPLFYKHDIYLKRGTCPWDGPSIDIFAWFHWYQGAWHIEWDDGINRKNVMKLIKEFNYEDIK